MWQDKIWLSSALLRTQRLLFFPQGEIQENRKGFNGRNGFSASPQVSYKKGYLPSHFLKLFTFSRLTNASLPFSTSNCNDNTGSKSGNPADNSGNQGQKYVQGKVTDTKGNPVAGAKIIVDNTIYYNSGTTGSTDANGNYKISVSQGSWRVYAEMDRTCNGKVYKKLDLHPETDNSFAGVDGATVHFTWKLTGEKPAPLVGFYGGTAYLYADSESSIYDSENIEFTFTPAGNLIDGHPGQVIKRKGGARNSGYYSQVADIPIGKYQVTARHITSNKALKLRTAYEGNYAASMTIEFEPELNFCSRCATIQFTDQ